jgi:PAS domain S-box-containing protein
MPTTGPRTTIQEAIDLLPAIDEYLNEKGWTKTRLYEEAVREFLQRRGLPRPLDGRWNVHKFPKSIIAHKISKEGYILEVSPGWAKLLGVSQGQARYQCLTKFMTDESNRLFKKHLKLPLKDREPIFVREMVHADGTVIKVRVELTYREDARGQPIDAIAFLDVINK